MQYKNPDCSLDIHTIHPLYASTAIIGDSRLVRKFRLSLRNDLLNISDNLSPFIFS